MRPLERALDALRQVPGEPRGGHGLPAECYRDPEYAALESERVLRPEWHPVARSLDLPEPGDYVSRDLFGEPIVVLRDASAELRAFSRVCLHRASPIVEGSGNTKRFTCPYHRWSYDLDGRLRAAPLMESVPGFERKALCLPELALEEWQGFAMVNLDRDAEPLAPRLAALDELLAPWHFADFRSCEPLEYDSPWNWKVMVENFMESYHHLGAHPQTLQPRNPAKGTHALDLKGHFIALENPAAARAEPFWVFQVLPTLLFTLVRGETPLAAWYDMQIDSPAHFHLRIVPLLGAEAAGDAALVAGVRQAFDAIHQEDIAMCLGVQRGLGSRLWRPGPQSLQEKTLWMFHRYLADRMATRDPS